MMYASVEITQTTRCLLRIACVAALVATFMVLRLPLVHATDPEPPSMPTNLQVPEGHKAFLEGHAVGTQNYICLPASTGVAWTFVGPQATLFNDYERQIITHFLSPNPDESDLARATWQHSRDTSTVWAMAVASSSDPNFVASGAIPWLLLQIVGAEPGPTDGQRLTRTMFIQRLHTSGGIAPSIGCTELAEVGQRAFVPYTADYIFYRAVKRESDHVQLE
jgi:Protein of unknown function (DUF3455)